MEEGLAEFDRLEMKSDKEVVRDHLNIGKKMSNENPDKMSNELSIIQGNTNGGFVDADEDQPQIVKDKPDTGPVVIDINDDKELSNDVIINGINAVETNIARIQEAVNVQERHNIEDVESGPSSLVSNQKTPVMRKFLGICNCNIL